MVKHLLKEISGLTLVLLIVCAARDAGAITMLPQNLVNLLDGEIAFTGTCTAADAKVQGGLLVTTYTFSVTEVIKGDMASPFSFAQWGASREDAQRLGKAVVSGMPVYDCRNNAEYTLFLTCGSSGLCAPVGLGQGSFQVTESAEGKKQVINGYGNKALLTGLPLTPSMSKALSTAGVTPEAEGPIDYDRFMQLVKQMNQGH